MTSIDRLPALPQIIPSPKEVSPKVQIPEGGGFGETFKQFMSGVNDMQINAADKDLKFATGEIKDVHEVMAAAEEAGISLQMLIELRNKALDAYRELIRIQV